MKYLGTGKCKFLYSAASTHCFAAVSLNAQLMLLSTESTLTICFALSLFYNNLVAEWLAIQTEWREDGTKQPASGEAGAIAC